MHDIWYFLFEVMLELDPSCPLIKLEFIKYFENTNNPTSERIFVLYAAYVDYLNVIDKREGQIYSKNEVISDSLQD